MMMMIIIIIILCVHIIYIVLINRDYEFVVAF